MISIVSTRVLLTPKASLIIKKKIYRLLTLKTSLPILYLFNSLYTPAKIILTHCSFFLVLFFSFFFFSLFGLGVLFFQSPGGPTVSDFRNCAPLYVWYLCLHLGLNSKVGHIRNCHGYYYCSRLHQCILL